MRRRALLKSLTLAAGAAMHPTSTWAAAEGQAPPPASAAFAVPTRALARVRGKLVQPIQLSFETAGSEGTAITRLDGIEIDRRPIKTGSNRFAVYVDPVTTTRQATIVIEGPGLHRSAVVELKPVRQLLVYLLPHSHHDLGYTDLQAAVEEKQMQNITKGIALARKTATYPSGARFVWNLEVLWGADLYMQRRSAQEKTEFIDAVRKGWISLNGSYANELTGLCRPEELLELFRYGTELGALCSTNVDSAMMSDVPGYSWGTTTAMAQAGIRYFSAAPNFFDRIGTFMVAWQDKPFWWISPSGREKVLVWVPWTGYAMSHVMKLGDEWVDRYQQRMDDVNFPYDISYCRWSGHGDNAEPDPDLSEFVRQWNETYEWPRFAISSTSTAFSAFEQRYGSQLPHYQGDLTPYWEDGAGSSALETRMSRLAADRLGQAATLAAMLAPATYVPAAYHQAWRDVLLYSEHTWGAWCSVSDSESPFTTRQWDYKRDFAVKAQQRSLNLIEQALPQTITSASIDVHNTNSWDRSDVVLLSRDMSQAGDRVTDQAGKPVPSQRLASGQLAIFVSNVPAFATARYTLSAKTPHAPKVAVTLHGGVLDNGLLRAEIEESTGNLTHLSLHGPQLNVIQPGAGANEYLFLTQTDLAHLGRSGVPTLTIEDHGPLIATLRIESSAPGCKSFVRRVRLAAGMSHLEIANLVDKERAALNPHPGNADQGGDFAQHGSKESLQFGFPFAVPKGRMTMDIPLAVMQPEIDQLPGSCKNWLPVGRWIDVSNEQHGITWATLDAPLVELGGITATMLGSQRNPSIWRKNIEPTQTVYSWAINNHWGTNYRAYQEGPVEFRYALQPHRAWSAADSSKLAVGLTQPLIPSVAAASPPSASSMVRIEPSDVLALSLKPSQDGKAWMLRLFGASGQARIARLAWASPDIGAVSLSDLAEHPLRPMTAEIPVEGYELVTLRVERSRVSHA